MEIIKIHHPYSKEQIPAADVVLVLGFFDGVHKGHKKVIETGRKIADERGLKLALMTFDRHPSIVFKKIAPKEMRYLCSREKKIALMADLGVDYLYEVEFTEAFARIAPQAFVDHYIAALHAKVVVSGFDYTYGPRDIADVAHLPQYAQDRFEIVTVAKETDGHEKISSTRIRQSLEAGDMEQVTSLLGYPYETEGIVVHGEARGRQLGFPTANVEIDPQLRLPKEGVYVCQMRVGKVWYPAMGSIGHNDTFGENRMLTVEINILDFDQDIYGAQVVVRWNHFLREQVKFASVDELIRQLKQDAKDSAAYFEKQHL